MTIQPQKEPIAFLNNFSDRFPKSGFYTEIPYSEREGAYGKLHACNDPQKGEFFP